MTSSPGFPPIAIRRASYLALATAFVHIVFGAIVRISGSGMGCGDNWPKCYGYWFPPFDRMDLVIEVMHRYLAIALFAAIAVLVATVFRNRELPSVSGRGSVANASRLALFLWFAPAIFGGITVFTGNPPWATVVHKLLAVSLLAVLAVATMRAGGLGAASVVAGSSTGASGSSRAVGAATGAAVLALIVVLLGGLTAKIPGAAVACAGFPLCGDGSLGGGAQHLQLTHRILAYLLAAHLLALPFLFRKRNEPAAVQRAAWLGAGFGLLQIVWAGWMVTGGFPGVVRSLHQATGILIWVSAFVTLYLARLAEGRTRIAAQGTAAAGTTGRLVPGTAR